LSAIFRPLHQTQRAEEGEGLLTGQCAGNRFAPRPVLLGFSQRSTSVDIDHD